MAVTHINGIGNLMNTQFRVGSDQVDYDQIEGTNNHNETAVIIEYGGDSWFEDLFNDDTKLDFSCDTEKCSLDIAINSEVGINLFDEGSLHLIYNISQQKWSMTAWQEAKSRNWAFCSPNVVVKHVVSILDAVAKDDGMDCGIDCAEIGRKDLKGDLDLISRSIKNAEAAIAESSTVFVGEACTVEPPPPHDYFTDPDTPIPIFGLGA